MGLSNKAAGIISALIVGLGLTVAAAYAIVTFPDKIQQFAPMFNW